MAPSEPFLPKELRCHLDRNYWQPQATTIEGRQLRSRKIACTSLDLKYLDEIKIQSIRPLKSSEMYLAWLGMIAEAEMKSSIQKQGPLSRKDFEVCVPKPDRNNRTRGETQYRIFQLQTEDAKKGLEYLRNVSLLCEGYITRLP